MVRYGKQKGGIVMHILLGLIYIAFAAINSCIALMVYDAKSIWSKIMAGILLFAKILQ